MSKNIKLRPYQTKAINLARQSIAKGNKNVCLCIATGGGKSPIAREIVQSFRDKNKTGKVAYLTFRTLLIDQMKQTLAGLDVDIITLQKAGREETEIYDLAIIDEAHYAKGSKLQNNINAKIIISLTATPITPQGYSLDFDEIIDVVQLADLIDMGYASPVKVLSTSNVDTSSLKTRAGDFATNEAYDLMSKSSILKNIVEVYKNHAKDLRTLIYAVNIKHAEQLKDQFISAGIECDCVHSKSSTSRKAFDDFKSGKIDLLINVDQLTTGIDLPDIYCLILAAPTKSLIKATQIYGRATRLNHADPNKEALIIDCAEVIKNTQHPLQRFDFTRKKEDKNIKKCKKCGEAMKLKNREVKPIDRYEYVVISDYVCDCGYEEQVQNIKVVNLTLCEGCGQEFESTGGLEMYTTDKNLKFDLICRHCGHKLPFREILYTDNELKEVSLQKAISMGSTWEDVKVILRSEAKKAGYKWQWSDRALNILQSKNITPKQAIENIKMTIKSGKKIGSVVYC